MGFAIKAVSGDPLAQPRGKQLPKLCQRPHTCRLFNFLALLRKIFIRRLFLERFQKMDPELGAELTCLDATDHGTEVLGLKTISVTLL
jgi:hypothetical protein